MDTLEAQGGLSFRPGAGAGWPLSGPAQVRLADRRVSFTADRLRARSAQLAADGSLSFAKDLDLRYAFEKLGLSQLLVARAEFRFRQRQTRNVKF